MACFNLAFAEQLCIWIVIVVAIYKVIQIVLPWLAGFAGLPQPVMAIISVILWVIVAIVVIKIIFLLLGCLLGSGAFHLL